MSVSRQSLVLPFKVTTLTSGAFNQQYLTRYGFHHRGWDMTGNHIPVKEPVYASGEGVVVLAGRDNKVGYTVAIKYENVHNHKTKLIQHLIGRYFHLDSISCKVGDKVTKNTIIGIMGGSGATQNSFAIHLHVEFDRSIATPHLSGQVAGGSLIKAGSKATLINPNEIFCVDYDQKFQYLTVAFYLPADIRIPRPVPTTYFTVFKPVTLAPQVSSANQRLILPVNNMKLTCSYRNKAYETLLVNGVAMGTHFGIDFSYDTKIWASGNGTIVQVGYDNIFGYFVVVKYAAAYNWKKGAVQDVIFRYFHMSSVKVYKGQRVTKDTWLGNMGNTGMYTSGVHCHLEADIDTKYWNYTPTLTGTSTYFKAGNRDHRDTTFNPLEVLYVKASPPDNQRIFATSFTYINDGDLKLPINA